MQSGIGEMLKVHAIAGPSAFAEIAEAYEQLFTQRETLLRFMKRSLEIKRNLIEEDEFDRGPRNVLNYGHSFGHAIEAATGFGVPHGIAITMGMDLANYVAVELGLTPPATYKAMHSTLRANYSGYATFDISPPALLSALGKDKKNSDAGLRLVLPDSERAIRLVTQPSGVRLARIVTAYLQRERTV
jgi:3-dehydroquinate synthase